MEKKFNINDYGYVLGIFALAVCLVTFTYSCKTPSLAETRYVPYYLHDTVTVKPHPLSDAERQNALDKFYKYGYDKYYGPQFEKLQAIINLQAISNGKQAESIERLSQTLNSIRMRSIHNKDSMQKVDAKKDSINLELRHEILKEVTNAAKDKAQTVKQNSVAIDYLKGVVELLEWGFASLWIMVFLVALIAYLGYRKLKRDIKRANYV